MNMTTPTRHTTDVAIIGAGPAGLFSVFELGMLKIGAHVIDTLPAVGGQCSALYPEKPIYDIPGFPAIDAADLIKNLEAQAAPFNPTYHLGEQVVRIRPLSLARPNAATAASRSGGVNGQGPEGAEPPVCASAQTVNEGFVIETDKNTTITAKAIIIAAGCGAFGPNRPPMSGLEAYERKCVHYMVGNREQFRDQTLVIAGGGDSAVDWANALSPIAKHIYFVHRRDKFRAAPESVAQMQAKPNVEMVIPYQLDSLEGDGTTLSGVVVKTMDGEARTLPADHLLAFFGLSMELGPIAQWGLNLDGNHITIDPRTAQTSTPGIFAIGDIATYENKLKLILTGFAEAAQAAHAIRAIVYPGEAYHFEYSTTKGVQSAA